MPMIHKTICAICQRPFYCIYCKYDNASCTENTGGCYCEEHYNKRGIYPPSWKDIRDYSLKGIMILCLTQ